MQYYSDVTKYLENHYRVTVLHISLTLRLYSENNHTFVVSMWGFHTSSSLKVSFLLQRLRPQQLCGKEAVKRFEMTPLATTSNLSQSTYQSR